MNISNLQINHTYKNYKQLCEVLEDRAKAGNSKKAQLKEWERFFTYSKDGNKFIINKIYDIPLDKIENRGGARHFLPHAERMERVLMVMINDDDLLLSLNVLLRQMSIVNSNYSYANYNIKKTSQLINIDENSLKEFFDTSRRTFKDNMESMLNRLEDKALIYWNKLQMVCIANVRTPKNSMGKIKAESYTVIDEFGNEEIILTSESNTTKEYRQANDQEIELIKQIEGLVMDELDCVSKQELIIKDRYNIFKNKVNKILFNEANIMYYYDSYKIIKNKERLAREAEKAEAWLLDSNNLNSDMEERVLLNINVQDQVYGNMEMRKKKAHDKLDNNITNSKIKIRTDDNFLMDGHKMIDTFINLGYPDIKEKIKHIKVN